MAILVVEATYGTKQMDNAYIRENPPKENTSSSFLEELRNGAESVYDLVKDNPVETAIGVGLTTLAIIGSRGKVLKSLNRNSDITGSVAKPWNNPANLRGSSSFMDLRVARDLPVNISRKPWNNPANVKGSSSFMDLRVARDLPINLSRKPWDNPAAIKGSSSYMDSRVAAELPQMARFQAEVLRVNPSFMREVPQGRVSGNNESFISYIRNLMDGKSPLRRFDQTGYRPIPARTSALTRFDQSAFNPVPVRSSVSPLVRYEQGGFRFVPVR